MTRYLNPNDPWRKLGGTASTWMNLNPIRALLNTQALPSEHVSLIHCVLRSVAVWIWNIFQLLLTPVSLFCYLSGPLLKRRSASCRPRDRCKLWVPLSLRIPLPAEFYPHQLAPPPAWPTPGNPVIYCSHMKYGERDCLDEMGLCRAWRRQDMRNIFHCTRQSVKTPKTLGSGISKLIFSKTEARLDSN